MVEIRTGYLFFMVTPSLPSAPASSLRLSGPSLSEGANLGAPPKGVVFNFTLKSLLLWLRVHRWLLFLRPL